MNDILNQGIKIFRSNSPTILTGLSIAGFVSTIAFVMDATPKVYELVDAEKHRLAVLSDEQAVSNMQWPGYDTYQDIEISFWEKTKLSWKLYVPAVVMGTITIACIVGANDINLRRNAALASAYSLTDNVLKEYKNKVREVIGENKAKKIQDEISKDRMEAMPMSQNTIVFTGNGNHKIFDPQSGRYFECDIEKIRRTVNALNLRLRSEMYIPLNDLYYELGLKQTKNGDQLGWNIDDGDLIVDFSSHVSDTTEPCLVLDFLVAPKPDFY